MNNPPEPASGAAPAPAPSLVGRATEVGVLTGALERATGGEGSIVLVSGEAGVGKSRLTRELLARAREQGARIAVGRAAEGTGGRPFGMLVELLRAAARTAASTAERAACDSALAALAQESDAAGVVSRWAQIDAIVDALAAGSTAEPPLRVVAFEDLHWADASTMELITQVLRQMESVPILALATFRPPPADAQALLDFIENTRGLTARQRIDLEPLTEAAAEELVRSAAGTDVSTDAIADIVQRAAGNPLFLEEAARDAGRAARDGIAATRVPLAIRDLIQRRVSGLSEAAREIIAAFSVLGTDGDPNLIVLVLAARPDAVAQAVNELVAADLLAPDAEGRLAFRHALTRDAVYESLPVLRRRDLHARCADAIDVSEGERGAAAVAWHLQQVGNVDALRRAGRLLITASEQSLAQLAYEQAATQLRDAVRILTECRGDPAVLRQAALHLAEAQRLTCADDVSLDAFATVADDAALAGDAHTEATAAIGYERTFLATGRPRDGADARSITLLDRALDHLTAAGPLDSLGARVLAASAQARYFAGDHQSAQEMAHRAVDVARAMADAGAEASALNTLRAAITTPDTLDEVLSLTRTIVERAAEAGDVELQLEGLFWRIAALLEVGRRAEAEAALARYGVLAERIRQRWRLSELYRMRGMFAHLSGDADTARAMAEQALQFGLAAGNAESRMYYTAITAVAAPEPERREPIRLLMEDVPLDLTIVRWQAFMAYFAMCAGDRERTGKYMAIALETGLETVPRDHAWLIVIAWVAEAAAYLGDPRAAQAAYDLLLPYADRYVVATNAVCLGSVERLLARLAAVTGSDSEAEHRRRAQDRNDAIGARAWLEAAPAEARRVRKAFMFTDIVKSTDLVAALGDRAWEMILRWHNQTLGDLFRAHGGQQVVSTGDGFFVAFDDREQSIECAVAIQRRLAEHRSTNGFAPEVRIGLHVAEASEVEENYHGRGVHEAARIGALAGGGEILASRETAGPRATAGSTRSVSLKGIAEPVEVVTIAWQ